MEFCEDGFAVGEEESGRRRRRFRGWAGDGFGGWEEELLLVGMVVPGDEVGLEEVGLIGMQVLRMGFIIIMEAGDFLALVQLLSAFENLFGPFDLRFGGDDDEFVGWHGYLDLTAALSHHRVFQGREVKSSIA